MSLLQSQRRIAASVTLAIGALAACSSEAETNREAAGSLDTSIVKASTIIAAAGPGVQVTWTDRRSVKRAAEFRLTPINFTRFMAASDSVVSWERRDPSMREYLKVNITDAGSPDNDAGLKWLAANPTVMEAINSAGMSVRDYFVASIAIASAERFMTEPTGERPTATLSENAAFLSAHRSDLERLAALRENRPAPANQP